MNVCHSYVLVAVLPQEVVHHIKSFQKHPILVIQQAIRQYLFVRPILTEELYNHLVASISIPRLRFSRQSSMGRESWCCPYKQGFFWGFGKRCNRDHVYKVLYRNKLMESLSSM